MLPHLRTERVPTISTTKAVSLARVPALQARTRSVTSTRTGSSADGAQGNLPCGRPGDPGGSGGWSAQRQVSRGVGEVGEGRTSAS